MSNFQWIIWIIVLGVFVYTVGFAWVQRSEKNTLGAWSVFMIALLALIIPIFTILR